MFGQGQVGLASGRWKMKGPDILRWTICVKWGLCFNPRVAVRRRYFCVVCALEICFPLEKKDFVFK